MKIILPFPRGFCAGVERAINIVERTIETNKKYGKEIYVFNYIVHNDYIINYFEQKGIKFIKDIEDIKEKKGSIVIFSAHGVASEIEIKAKKYGLIAIDASCSLVKKIHIEASKLSELGYYIIIIGKINHPEVVGTIGRVKDKKRCSIVFSEDEILKLNIKNESKIYYVVQTTLGVLETKNIIKCLKNKFPNIKGQELKDICYATKNRQEAIIKIIEQYRIDHAIVVGSKISSNSNSLKNIFTNKGINAYMISNANDLIINNFTNDNTIVITSGASTPEILIEMLLKKLAKNFNLVIDYYNHVKEDIKFRLPKELEW